MDPLQRVMLELIRQEGARLLARKDLEKLDAFTTGDTALAARLANLAAKSMRYLQKPPVPPYSKKAPPYPVVPPVNRVEADGVLIEWGSRGGRVTFSKPFSSTPHITTQGSPPTRVTNTGFNNPHHQAWVAVGT